MPHAQGLTNWGDSAATADLTPDEDSLEITAVFKGCNIVAPTDQISVRAYIEPGPAVAPVTSTFETDENPTVRAYVLSVPHHAARRTKKDL